MQTIQAIFQALQLYSWGFAMLKIYLNHTSNGIEYGLNPVTICLEYSTTGMLHKKHG